MLTIRDVEAFYGKSQVLRGVSLSVAGGEIVALLGRNGSGRSTLAKAIVGLVERRGSIHLGAEELIGEKTFRIAQLGVGYVPENRDVFPELTVEENLRLGESARAAKVCWRHEDIFALFPRLKERLKVPAGVLSGGEQQMLTLARALLGNPDVLVIDEPTEGLAPKVIELLAEFFHAVRARGVAMLLIEQKMSLALDVATRVAVMGHGRIVFEGSPRELTESSDITREWLEV
ncbi:ABC transporter ATP-binding protein [Acidimangrovimonas pyrenivorans]|uniref:ABC transporter ATP-binding protein n=1 Tax=Acidimangrovimonas pyrenivorans TaxID=2030798 RepID=A0ABV7ADL7_9RHOB